MEKLAYNVEEASEMLSISRRTLYELIRTNEIGSIKVGNRRLLRHTDMTSFLESRGLAA